MRSESESTLNLFIMKKPEKKSRRDHVDDESIMQSHLQYKRFD